MPARMSTAPSKVRAARCALWILLLLNGPFSSSFAQSQPPGRGAAKTLLCFISDTQETLFFEHLYLTSNNNELARSLLFEKILELNPSAVFHLGDLVSAGSSDGSWDLIDAFVKELRDLGIDFFPIPGNHEYFFFSSKGISRFTSRYPYARLTGYAKRYANLAVILLNSNFGKLSDEEARAQLIWYQKTLQEYENDDSVDFVIVACHHSPFTNSKIVTASEEVRNKFVTEYFKSRKSVLFVSGHAHAFEHFQMNGKDFLVIGGGGGIQQPLSTGEDAEYKDLFSTSLRKRMFHFLAVRTYEDSLTVELKMLKEDFKGFDELPQLIFAKEKSPK